jgi:hypothetical protein
MPTSLRGRFVRPAMRANSRPGPLCSACLLHGLLWTFWALPATLFVMISHRLIHIFSHESWTFRPDIRPSNIRAKLPENHANILLSGQIAPSII